MKESTLSTVKEKRWILLSQKHPDLSDALIKAAGGSRLVAQLLINRGLDTPEKVQDFLDLANYQETSGLELPDMQAGLDRIHEAIDKQQNILVWGDFDVDGVTGTSVLYETLKHLGAQVTFYIPDRATEGHGLNSTAICRLVSSRKVKLVITTDNGSGDFAEVSLLNGLGVDTIITDHHHLPENLAPAVANINPLRYEDKEHPLALLSGVGVAYKLCELLVEQREGSRSFVEGLLDLTAIGLIADMVPLLKENRYLVWRGLQVLNQRKRLGLNEILTQANVPPDAKLASDTVGFTIGPRINALGRLDKALDAVTLITTQDKEEAKTIALRLESLNKQRQDLCDETFQEAEKILKTRGFECEKVIAIGSPKWNPGITGIVASRLKEKYNVPVFMMVSDEESGEVRCSARSIEGFHLYDAMKAIDKHFTHYGGHSGAGGFGMPKENLDAFKRDLYDYVTRHITDEMMQPEITVDAKLTWDQLTPGLIELLDTLAPYGMGNAPPYFIMENAYVGAQRELGNQGQHLKAILTEKPKGGKHAIDALFWRFGTQKKFQIGEAYNFVVAPELNTYQGNTRVQLIAQDYKHAGSLSSTVSINSKQEAPQANASSKAPEKAKAAASAENSSKSGSMVWIDHRDRESVDAFMAQLMQPQKNKGAVRLYHEGRKPDIPFLEEELIIGRAHLDDDFDTVEDLILWDMPPTQEALSQVIERVSPKTVHLVGGKYQSVPLFPKETDYLKVLLQFIKRDPEIEISQLAANLATSEDVVLNGLMLLQKLGMVTVKPIDSDSDGEMVSVALIPNPPVTKDIHQHLEFVTFKKALRQVSFYRNALLNEPIETIQSSLGSLDVVKSLVSA